MSDLKMLFLIYAPDSQGEYFIYHIFGREGGVDREVLEAAYQHQKGDAPRTARYPHLGPFEDSQQLKDFAFALCQERRQDKIVLMTVEDFNGVVEQHAQSTELFAALEQVGESLENLSKEPEGFFSKIFR